MLIYLLVFGASIGLTVYGEYLNKKENRKGFYLCMIFAVLLVVLLAGLRAVPVGTDGPAYERWVYNAAECTSFEEARFVGRSTEPVFMLLVYFVAKTTGSVYFLFALTALFAYGLFMAALIRLRNDSSIPFAWAAYLFLFFGHSLNELRQALAMTALVLAFVLLREKKYLFSGIVVIAAVLCHNSAGLIAAGMLVVYCLLQKWDTWFLKVGILAATALAVFGYEPVFYQLNRVGILPDRFSGYVAGASFIHFSLNPILVRLPFFLLVLFFYRDYAKDGGNSGEMTKVDADFLLVMMGMEMILSELRVISVPLYRICLYFGVFRCLGIGRLVYAVNKSEKYKKWSKPLCAALIGMLVVIWLYQVVLQGNDEIYPYTSEILHIGADTLF